MDSTLTQVITRLSTGEILRIDDAQGQSIVLVKGMLWVTQEGDVRDVFLSDGDSFAFDRPGTALAQAITDTSLIALVDDSAEVIEPASPVSGAEPGEDPRALTALIRLHRGLAALALSKVPAHRFA